MTQASETGRTALPEAVDPTGPGGVHYEAGLLARIASARSYAEQQALTAELAGFRQHRAEQASSLAALPHAGDLGRVRPTAATEPWQPWTRVSMDSDWLGDAEPDEVDLGQVTQAMVAKASAWYSRDLHPMVREAGRAEVLAHADGAASRAAGPYGTAYPAAHQAFMDHMAHLVQAEQVAPTSDGVPATINQQTFDGLQTKVTDRPKADGTKKSDSPSLQEGSAPEGDVSQGLDDHVTQTGHDAGPQGLQHSVDYLSGTSTAPTNGSGMTSMSALSTGPRGMAAHAASFLQSLGGPPPFLKKDDDDKKSPPPPPHHDAPPAPHDGPKPDQSGMVPCPQCLGEGVLDDGSPCDLCQGSGMVAPDVAQQWEAAQGSPAPAPLAGPPPQAPTRPVAARRVVADGVAGVAPMSSDRGGLAESLDEGTEPEGDQAAAGERLAEPVSHDAGPGNGSATDYLDGRQYEWGTGASTAGRRQASPTLPGPLPGAPAAQPQVAAPVLTATPQVDPMTGMPMTPSAPAAQPGWEDQFVASLDPEQLAVVRQALHQSGGGGTPLATSLADALSRSQNAMPAGTPLTPDSLALDPAAQARLSRFRAAVSSRGGARTAGVVDNGVRTSQRRGMTHSATQMTPDAARVPADQICLDCDGTGVWSVQNGRNLPGSPDTVCDTCAGTGLAEPSLAVHDPHMAALRSTAAQIDVLAGGMPMGQGEQAQVCPNDGSQFFGPVCPECGHAPSEFGPPPTTPAPVFN